MFHTTKVFEYVGTIHSSFLQFWNSSFLQRIIDVTNNAYLKGEQHSRDFIIRKLDLDDYVCKNGWVLLLKSMTSKQVELLRRKLAVEKKDQ